MIKESAGTHIPSFIFHFCRFLARKWSFVVKICDFQYFFVKMAKNAKKKSKYAIRKVPCCKNTSRTISIPIFGNIYRTNEKLWLNSMLLKSYFCQFCSILKDFEPSDVVLRCNVLSTRAIKGLHSYLSEIALTDIMT